MNSDAEKKFDDLLPEFYRYMITTGKIVPKTARDYISRLRFLSDKYNIDSKLTQTYINDILSTEEDARSLREIYSTKKAMSISAF